MLLPSSLHDVVALTGALIAVPSVTPARGTVFDVLDDALARLGFTVERFIAGEGPDGPVENLIAIRAGMGRCLAFAGHVDVVPAGIGWTSNPFAPEERGGLLYGRGAVDMKGAVAAFVAAAARVPRAACAMLITGDEEGPATFGTQAILARLASRDWRPDCCLVGEPTSSVRLGDTIKIGRRGSLVSDITVPGRQGHVAYPHLADNPVPKLVRALAALDAVVLDRGTDWFQPSNLEIIDVTVGNPTSNVIPDRASARVSIRFNDQHRGDDLARLVADEVRVHAPNALIETRVHGEAFLTPPGDWSSKVANAVHTVTGFAPELSTTGGTSDARFLSRLCPTVELGLINATMHKVDEAVAVSDLHGLADIYTAVLERLD